MGARALHEPGAVGVAGVTRETYDERRMSPVTCACGRQVSHGGACAAAGVCLMDRRAENIAAIQQRQKERRGHVHEWARTRTGFWHCTRCLMTPSPERLAAAQGRTYQPIVVRV